MPRPPLARSLLLAALPLAACAEAPDPFPREPAPDFALLDHRGRHHELHGYTDARAVVLFAYGIGCPIARQTLPALEALRERFADDGVAFLLLDANPQDDRDAVAAEAEAFGIGFPVLVDRDQLVAATYGVTRTAEAIVVDAADWTVAWRGPVDDRLGYEAQRAAPGERYLAEALDALVSGEPVRVRPGPVRGCAITRLDAGAPTPDYATEVAPILARRCGACHVEGGIGPFALDGHDAARGWSAMIREVVLTGRMPPWDADPHFGRFANARELPPDEARALVRWIDAGAPRGDGPDPLATVARHEPPEWPLGEPDLVLEVRPFDIPATGLVPYRFDEVPVPLDEDVWLRAVDFQPGNRAVVHHAFAFLNPPGHRDDPRVKRWKTGIYAVYAPGLDREAFPEGTGKLVPAGSTLEFQLHYTPTGRPETDRSRIGLYFADEPPAHELRIDAAANLAFEVPPGAREHRVEATLRFSEDVVVHKYLPHMHYRGKWMRYEAHFPDGSTETLLSVPRHRFAWQILYELEEPRRLPAGTRVVVTGAYDNSTHNPENPDPSVAVRFGRQSTDEMFIGYVEYHVPGSHGTSRATPRAGDGKGSR